MDGQWPLPHMHPKDKEKQKSNGHQTTLFNKDASMGRIFHVVYLEINGDEII
jgi:hypothetical protein